MRFLRRRFVLILATVVVLTTLAFGLQQQSKLKPGPIPKPDALAQPKSLHQAGLPDALTRSVIPPDNPQTDDKIALGQKLFFDGRLSANATVACSSCHNPAQAFTDGRPSSVGIKGRVGQRNAPTILNALYNKTQFWEGVRGRSRTRPRFRSSTRLRWDNPRSMQL